MKGHKAFKKGLVCRGKRYAENTVFEESFDFASQNIKSQIEASDSTRFADDNNAELVCGNNAMLVGGHNTKLVGGNGAILVGGDNTKLVGGIYAILTGGYNATVVGDCGSTLMGGNNAVLVGDYATKLIGGNNSIIVGNNGSTVKGKKGSVIVLVERDGNLSIVNFKAVQVDGEKIKEDVLYRLKNGEFVEVKE